MNRLLPTAILLGALALAGVLTLSQAGHRPPAPAAPTTQPKVVPAPAPAPAPAPKPGPKRPICPGPWGRPVLAVGQPERVCGSLVGETADGPVHGGREVQADLPADLCKRNIAAKGLGCCVFRSGNYCGLYQNVPQVIDWPEWMVSKGIEGGGYPSKVDRLLKQVSEDRKMPVPGYVQVEGKGAFDFVKKVLASGRMVCITYGSEHMVTAVYYVEDGAGAGGAWRDNNRTGPQEIRWADSPEEFRRKSGGGSCWAWAFTAPRPPAPPRSSRHQFLAAADPERLLTAPLVPGRYEWRGFSDEPDQWALWRDGRQCGAFTAAEDYYRELSGTVWGRRWKRPPVQLPPQAFERLDAQVPGGVVAGQLAGHERYTVCGAEVSAEDAFAAIPDDATWPSLTVIGPEADRKRVLDDLATPEFSPWAARCCVQSYAPDNWAVARYGFVTGGHPTIYLQTPDGTVLYRADAYDGPATLQAVRKADPSYQPDKDPGPNGPSTPGLPSGVPVDHLCAGGVALAALAGCLAAAKLRRS